MAVFIFYKCRCTRNGKKVKELVVAYLGVVQRHLELVEVEPVPGFFRAEVVVEVASSEPKRMELAVRVEQKRGRRLVIDYARVTRLQRPHHRHTTRLHMLQQQRNTSVTS